MKSTRGVALAVFFMLALLSTVADAEVLIYRGTGRITRGNGTERHVVITTLFFVLDTTNLGGSFVFAQNIAGAKSVFDDGQRAYGLAQVGASNSKYTTYTNASGSYNNFQSFTFSSARLGGVDGKIFLTAGAPTFFPAPRALSGSYSLTTGTPLAIDGTFALVIDTIRTQFANKNTLTAQQAVNKLVNDYASPPFNYQKTVPNP